jgi:hypothetical protein
MLNANTLQKKWDEEEMYRFVSPIVPPTPTPTLPRNFQLCFNNN